VAKRLLSQVQAVEMKFLQKLNGVML